MLILKIPNLVSSLKVIISFLIKIILLIVELLFTLLLIKNSEVLVESLRFGNIYRGLIIGSMNEVGSGQISSLIAGTVVNIVFFFIVSLIQKIAVFSCSWFNVIHQNIIINLNHVIQILYL